MGEKPIRDRRRKMRKAILNARSRSRGFRLFGIKPDYLGHISSFEAA